MDKFNEDKLREEYRRQFEEKEKLRESERGEKERGNLSRMEYLRREKIRQEEEKKFYEARGYVKIKNKYGDGEWVSSQEFDGKKHQRKKHSKSKSRKNFMFLREIILFIFLMIVLYGVYRYFSHKTVPNAATASLYVYSDIPGARIFLSGKFTNRYTPDTLSGLKPGPYWVVVDKEGFEEVPSFININLKSGDKEEIEFSLKSGFKSAPVIISGVEPPFSFYIDGLFGGESPHSIIEVPLGKHLVKVEKKGYRVSPASQWIVVDEQGQNNLLFSVKALVGSSFLRVTSNVTDAYIFINQHNSGSFPAFRFLEMVPGAHEIRLAHPQYRFIPDKKLVDLKEGAKVSLVFTGQRQKEKGQVLITGDSNAQISIDGHLLPAVVGCDTFTMSAGEHQIATLGQSGKNGINAAWTRVPVDTTIVLTWNSRYLHWTRTKGHF